MTMEHYPVCAEMWGIELVNHSITMNIPHIAHRPIIHQFIDTV